MNSDGQRGLRQVEKVKCSIDEVVEKFEPESRANAEPALLA